MKRDDLDRAIEREYYARAAGRTIDILRIPDLFRDVRANVMAGGDIGNEVQDAIDRYCEPKEGTA